MGLEPGWTIVCEAARIAPDTGVAALVDGEQVAVFRTRDFRVFVIANHDPCSGANVLSRGIIGSAGHEGRERVTVASPVYKHRFDLETGECLDDPAVAVEVYDVVVRSGVIHVRPAARAEIRTAG